MEPTVPTSVLFVCIIFTALITTLVFMTITCCTMRMKRFDIRYQIEQEQTESKIRELNTQEFETRGAERRAQEAGYGKDDIENLAPYFQIDLRGNLEKKVKADQDEAERKAYRKSGWFKRSIAEVSAPAEPRVNEQERIRQQLEAHSKLQEEQLQASFARFNTTVASGNRLPSETQQFDFGTGEIRSQAAELEFHQQRRKQDEILPMPARSPVPSAMGSPISIRSMTLGTASPRTLNKASSANFRRIEGPSPFDMPGSMELRATTSDGRLRSANRSRPGTPGSMMSYREDRPQGPAYGGYGHSRNHSYGRSDGSFNPNNVL